MIIINTAYLDPSVITIAFSAIAGVAVTIGAVIAIWYRKFKMKIKMKLNIDDETKKEIEADVTGNFGD